jgi:hypothetical protein
MIRARQQKKAVAWVGLKLATHSFQQPGEDPSGVALSSTPFGRREKNAVATTICLSFIAIAKLNPLVIRKRDRPTPVCRDQGWTRCVPLVSHHVVAHGDNGPPATAVRQ